MKFFLLLGLSLVAGLRTAEGREETRDGLFTLDGPALDSSTRFEEDAWRPFPHLRYEGGGTAASPRGYGDGLPPGSRGEPFDWREVALPKRSMFQSILDPLESIVESKHVRVSWDRAASEVSFSRDLSTLANSLGATLSAGAFLGICVDLLEFPECDGGRLPQIDPRHGELRPGNISTGFGLTLGF